MLLRRSFLRGLCSLSPSDRARLEAEAVVAVRDALPPQLARPLRLSVQPTGFVEMELELFSGAVDGAALEADASAAASSLPWSAGARVSSTLRAPPSFMGAAAAPASLEHVGALVGVSSCKGGVGKSTISSNLAFALAGLGARVGLLDADVHGPSLPTLLTLPKHSLPVTQRADSKLLVPPQVGGVKLMSYGYIAKGVSSGLAPAALMRGPMVAKVIGQMLSGTEWGALDYLIVDMPPGTGDAHFALCQTYGLTAAAVVSTPQRLARADVLKGIDALREHQVPLVAVVENMGYFRDESGKVHTPFGTSQLESITEYARVDKSAAFRLPLEPALSASCDEGLPLVVSSANAPSDVCSLGVAPRSEAASVFGALARHVVRAVADLQHASATGGGSSLRFDPARGVVLRVLSGRDEGREFVLPRDMMNRLPGAPPARGPSPPVPVSIEACESGEQQAVKIVWDAQRESLISIDELKLMTEGGATGTVK